MFVESVIRDPVKREEYLLRALCEMPDTEIYDRMPVGAQDVMRDLGRVVKCKDMGSRFSFVLPSHIHGSAYLMTCGRQAGSIRVRSDGSSRDPSRFARASLPSSVHGRLWAIFLGLYPFSTLQQQSTA